MRTEQVELTVLCLIHKDGSYLLQDRVKNDWKGYTLPGGHIEPGESIAVLIGPEGGIDEAEVEMAMKAKVEPITLGKRILRTETAGMTVLSILVYLLEGRERTR